MSGETRVSIITGGAGGLGFAIALRLARHGDRVALWDINLAAAQAAASRLPDAIGLDVDVTNPGSVAAATRAVADRWGRIDVLVNAAGITGPQMPTDEYPLDGWDRVIAINLTGTFLCCRAVVPVMKRSPYGRIINIASIGGKEGNAGQCAYSASKAGVMALTKSLGKELALTSIRANSVAPAFIMTELAKQMTPEFVDFVVSKIPMGRPGEAHEVAALVDWLASEDCSFSTGACYDISGGRATY